MQFDIPENRSKIRILAIEDEILIREFVCDFLEDIGFKTLQASNGKMGIELCRKENPDLILTDLRMPEMNGLDVLSILQKEFPDKPVIVISGTGSLNDVVQSLKFGAWDYILKPIHDYSVLEMAVTRVLERKYLLDENKKYKEHLEEEVIKRTDELMKSTHRFKTLFESAGDAIFIHDLQGKLIDVNQQAVCYLGYTRGQLLQMNMRDIFIESEAEHFFRYLETLPEKSRVIYESLHKHSNGTPIPIEVNACVITMDSSPQILAICRDITERKRAEEERNKLEKQMITAQKMESIGLLASGVAHDFNNILSALYGYTTLFGYQIQPGTNEAEYLSKINDIISMGQSITKRITTFVRKDKDELVDIDIHKLISDSETLLRPNCKNISIVLDLKAEHFHILGDEGQIQNAFLNLGINARDAMPSGGKLIFTTSNIKDENTDMLRIAVTDTGTGMTKEVLSKIFDPLFTTKERGKGTGLGLASVLYCIKNLHGKIDVQSTPGQGTTFTILIPIVNQQSVTTETKCTVKKSIGIISDEKSITNDLVERLSSYAISPQVHNELQAAIDWISSNKDSVSLILLDYYLPFSNETSTISAIRKCGVQVPIIVFSSKDKLALRKIDSAGLDRNFQIVSLYSDRFYESIFLFI